MNKKLVISTILVLIIIVLSGCSQSMMYSEKFEGIPIYPGMDLISSSDYEENYELLKFEGTFKKVKEFYIENINQEKWKIGENPFYQNQENSFVVSEGYILKGANQEVSLIIERIKTKDKNAPLYIKINGSPLEEGKYRAEGHSESWKTSLGYIIRKDTILVKGYVTYLGDHPPKEVDSKVLLYDMVVNPFSNEGLTAASSIWNAQGKTLGDSRINISLQSARYYELEDYKEAINNAYIEIAWEEEGKEKTEKINIEVVE